MISLTLLLLGQIDLEGMQQANPDFGTLFFLIYMVVMFLILMNIFLAILGEAYSLVRERAMKEKERQLKLKKGPARSPSAAATSRRSASGGGRPRRRRRERWRRSSSRRPSASSSPAVPRPWCRTREGSY